MSIRDEGAQSTQRRVIGNWFRQLAGALIGIPCAVAILLSIVVLSVPGVPSRLRDPLQRRELNRIAYFFPHRDVPRGHSDANRGYLLAQAMLSGVLGILVLNLAATALIFGLGAATDLFGRTGRQVTLAFPGVHLVQSQGWIGAMYFLGAAFLAIGLSEMLARLQESLIRRFFGPLDDDMLRARIAELTETRRGIVEAVDDERRRIERDLHDGVQQRIVALTLLLGRAKRAKDPDRNRELLTQAHTDSQNLIDELRQVAWRIYPTALDELGLVKALWAIAENAPLPVSIHNQTEGRVPRSIQTAVYFLVREGITNAVKHSGAESVTVTLAERPDSPRGLNVRVSDDGCGGAHAGGGLLGLSRRFAALDGTFSISSPPGGPTVLEADIPWGAET